MQKAVEIYFVEEVHESDIKLLGSEWQLFRHPFTDHDEAIEEFTERLAERNIVYKLPKGQKVASVALPDKPGFHLQLLMLTQPFID